MELKIKNETSRLRMVVLGSVIGNGPTPMVKEAYDPKSLEHIMEGSYPLEQDMLLEMEAFNRVFYKYKVVVFVLKS